MIAKPGTPVTNLEDLVADAVWDLAADGEDALGGRGDARLRLDHRLRGGGGTRSRSHGSVEIQLLALI